MPKSLRYGLVIAAIMGVLFLTAYIFRNQLADTFNNALREPYGGLLPDDASGDETNPFANSIATSDELDTDLKETNQ